MKSTTDILRAGLNNSMASIPWARLSRGFGAQGVNQIVTILTQLGLVPFLIIGWGAERYGIWLMLTTIPTYVSLSNLGFTQVAGNEMTALVASGDRSTAQRVLHSVTALLSIISLCIVVLSVAAVAILTTAMPLPALHQNDGAAVALVLVCVVVLAQIQGLDGAVLQSTNRLSHVLLFGAAGRAIEGIAVAIIAWHGGGFLAASLAMLAARAVVVVLQHLHSSRTTPDLRVGISDRSWPEVRTMFPTSAAYMLVPTASALIVQGPLLLIGFLLTPAAVALFSVTRTLTRLGLSLMTMANAVMGPEYASRRDDGHGLRSLYRLHMAAAIVLAAGFLIACVGLGPLAIRLYTSNVIHPSYWLVAGLALAVAFEMVWNTSLTTVVAINRHVSLSITLFAITLLTCAAAYPMTIAWGLLGAVTALVIYNLAMLFVSFRIARGALHTPVQERPR